MNYQNFVLNNNDDFPSVLWGLVLHGLILDRFKENKSTFVLGLPSPF